MHIGNRLKKIRSLKGVPQSKVCKGIVSPSHYSNIESGRYEASEDILESIAERLHVPTKYLVGIHDDSPTTSELLLEYAKLVEEDLDKADAFYKKRKKQLEYIPSIHQEMEYLLIRCMHHLKKLEISEAEKRHHEVSFYIQKGNIDALSNRIKFNFYYVAGLLKFYSRQYLESYTLNNKALQFSKKEVDQAKILFNLALICYNINDKQKGLIYAQDAKNIFIDLHQWAETVEAYNLLGILYTDIGEYADATEIFKKGLNLSQEKEFQLLTAKILHNLGLIHLYTEEFKTSLEYFNRSLNKKIAHEPESSFVTYLAILNVYLKKQDFRNLKITLADARASCQTLQHQYQLKAIEAEMEYLLLNYEKYEELMEECIDYFYTNQYWNDLEDFSKHFSDYLYEQRKYKKSHYYLDIELQTIKKLYKERFE